MTGDKTWLGDTPDFLTMLRPAQRAFLFVLVVYLVFPREEGLKTLGFGPEGGRLLFLDVFVVGMLLFCAAQYRRAWQRIKGSTGLIPWLLFFGSVVFSLVRGLPTYGGFALGEARWYACAILVPVGYLLYDAWFARRFSFVVILAASIQASRTLVQVAQGEAWDMSDEIMRFAGGRESLVIALGVLVLMDQLLRFGALRRKWWRFAAIIGFTVIIVINQTRSLFLILPAIMFTYLMMQNRITRARVAKLVVVGVLLGAVIVVGLGLFLPSELEQSILASFEVAAEGFSASTLNYALDPLNPRTDIASEFSRAGNTAFRLLAWSQVLSAISEAPGGWFYGMPMGSGFEFFDPSGHLWENLEPHNDYLSIVSKIGLIGFVGYGLILVQTFRLALRSRRATISAFLRSDALLFLCIVLLLSVFGSLNAEMRTYGTHFWIWPFIGITVRSLEIVSYASETREPFPEIASAMQR